MCAIQRELDRLKRWGHVNLMKLSWAKQKLLYLGRGNDKCKHRLAGESSPGEDLEAGYDGILGRNSSL